MRYSDLPTLAIHSAIDIDNQILNRENLRYDNIFKLGKTLYELTEGDRFEFTLIKPLEQYRGNEFKREDKMEDLVNEVRRICDNLGQIPLLKKEEQEIMRDFCVSLFDHTRILNISYQRRLVA